MDGRGRTGLLSIGFQEEKVETSGLLWTLVEWSVAERQGFEPWIRF